MLFFRLTTFLLLSLTLGYFPSFANADETAFSWPIGCIPGVTCAGKHFRIGYPDISGSGLSFACSKPGYQGHQGTDIVISAVEQAIPVLAAADGTVRWIKDGLFDHCPSDTNKDCDEHHKSILSLDGSSNGGNLGFNAGNFVMLEHKLNDTRYLTLYAHLRTGTVTVKPGQKITRGDRLAEVGSSGNAQIPHLHFGVYREQAGMYKPVDPWKGPCNNSSEGLWAATPPYRSDEILLANPAIDTSNDSLPYMQSIQRNLPKDPAF